MQQAIKEAVYALVDLLPPDWSQVWLRVELPADGSQGTLRAYAALSGEPSVAALVALPPEAILPWKDLRHIMAEQADPWTVSILKLSNDGKFDLRHEYGPLDDGLSAQRHDRWITAALEGFKIR